ncbi:MAG: hypothetical protein AB7F78_21695, partial [Hyphomicrobiaceae bacterium]
ISPAPKVPDISPELGPLPDVSQIGEPLREPASALNQAAKAIEAAAERLQVPQTVVVGGGGGQSSGTPTASAPGVATPNGSSYRGR